MGVDETKMNIQMGSEFDFAHGWLKKERRDKLFQTSDKG